MLPSTQPNNARVMFPLDDGENSDGDASQPEKTNNLKRAASAGDDENASRKRRNRAVLSCRPCKARKIKSVVAVNLTCCLVG